MLTIANGSVCFVSVKTFKTLMFASPNDLGLPGGCVEPVPKLKAFKELKDRS